MASKNMLDDREPETGSAVLPALLDINSVEAFGQPQPRQRPILEELFMTCLFRSYEVW